MQAVRFEHAEERLLRLVLAAFLAAEEEVSGTRGVEGGQVWGRGREGAVDVPGVNRGSKRGRGGKGSVEQRRYGGRQKRKGVQHEQATCIERRGVKEERVFEVGRRTEGTKRVAEIAEGAPLQRATHTATHRYG
eukprot:181636-Chlamydomonas_euryale.AAC.4